MALRSNTLEHLSTTLPSFQRTWDGPYRYNRLLHCPYCLRPTPSSPIKASSSSCTRSDKSFGSPAVSTFLRALRLQWLDTIPRLTAALVSAHRPNSVATALGHLDQKRQGLDSTTKPRPPVNTVPVIKAEPSLSNDDCRDPMEPDDEDPYDPGRPPELSCKLVTAADIDASGRFCWNIQVCSGEIDEYDL